MTDYDEHEDLSREARASRSYMRKQLNHTHCSDPEHDHDNCEKCNPVDEDNVCDEQGSA